MQSSVLSADSIRPLPADRPAPRTDSSDSQNGDQFQDALDSAVSTRKPDTSDNAPKAPPSRQASGTSKDFLTKNRGKPKPAITKDKPVDAKLSAPAQNNEQPKAEVAEPNPVTVDGTTQLTPTAPVKSSEAPKIADKPESTLVVSVPVPTQPVATATPLPIAAPAGKTPKLDDSQTPQTPSGGIEEQPPPALFDPTPVQAPVTGNYNPALARPRQAPLETSAASGDTNSQPDSPVTDPIQASPSTSPGVIAAQSGTSNAAPTGPVTKNAKSADTPGPLAETISQLKKDPSAETNNPEPAPLSGTAAPRPRPAATTTIQSAPVKAIAIKTGEGDGAAAALARSLIDGITAAPTPKTDSTPQTVDKTLVTSTPFSKPDITPVATTQTGETKPPMTQVLATGARGADQVEQAARLLSSSSNSSGRYHVTMQLDPPDMGRLRLEVSMQDHMMTLKVDADTSEVARLIQSRLPELKDSLSAHGIQIDRTEVAVRSSPSTENGGRDGSQSNRSFSDNAGSGFSQDSHGWQGQRSSEGHADRNAWVPDANIPVGDLTSASLHSSGSPSIISNTELNLVA